MDNNRDIDIELYDLIFNARKDDDAIYNDDGSVKYIRNVRQINQEFMEAEKSVKMMSYLIDQYDLLYESMVDSYVNQPLMYFYCRRNYILGMTFVKALEKKKKVKTEAKLGNLVNKYWNDYLEFSDTYIHDKAFDDDFTFLGIYDQTVTQSYNRKQKKK